MLSTLSSLPVTPAAPHANAAPPAAPGTEPARAFAQRLQDAQRQDTAPAKTPDTKARTNASGNASSNARAEAPAEAPNDADTAHSPACDSAEDPATRDAGTSEAQDTAPTAAAQDLSALMALMAPPHSPQAATTAAAARSGLPGEDAASGKPAKAGRTGSDPGDDTRNAGHDMAALGADVQAATQASTSAAAGSRGGSGADSGAGSGHSRHGSESREGREGHEGHAAGDTAAGATLQQPLSATQDLPATRAAFSLPEASSFSAALAAAASAASLPSSPAAATADTAAAQAQLPAALGSADFAPQLGAQISTFVRDGVQHAQLHLNPAEMGPVTVQIQLDGQAAQVSLLADLAQTRQALEQAMPQLAGSLREAGLTLTGGGVFQQPRQTGGDTGGRDGNSTRSRGGVAAVGGAPSAGDTPAHSVAAPRRRGVVDLVA